MALPQLFGTYVLHHRLAVGSTSEVFLGQTTGEFPRLCAVKRVRPELSRLPEDGLVRVTVFAVDEAGNEGFGQGVFGVNVVPTFSCRAHAGAAILWPFGLIVVLLRRRPRAGTSKR